MILNTHTYYSLRFGTFSTERLLSLYEKNDFKKGVLTDVNSTTACMDFIRIARKKSIKPIVGVDFRNKARQEFIVLAKNETGFKAINDYLSSLLFQKNFKVPERAPVLNKTIVIYPFIKIKQNQELLPDEWIGIHHTQLNTKQFLEWQKGHAKFVVLQTATFNNKKDFNTHRLLRAIDNNTLLSKLSKNEQGQPFDVMVSAEVLEEKFSEYPEIIKNTKYLINQCSITIDSTKTKNQKSYTNNEALDYRLMQKLAYKGLIYRYKHPGRRVFKRLEKELSIIKEKGFVSYFLINWKILKYARSKGYYYVGRGSGANSIVAYLLRITDVDPIELDLYFERFINLYRKNPPDFDIDFSWKNREDITDFIFERFPNTALLAVYNTFKYKAAIREIGKVFGLPKMEIDMLSNGKFNLNQLDELSKLVVLYSELIQNFPNYLGIHAGGIVISEKPIHCYTATFLPPKGYPTTQFDMVVAEDIGLYKFDILSQRGLGKIKDAVDLINANLKPHQHIDIHDIKRFKEDQKIKYLLKNAKAIGCFYVESPAMRMLLKKLQVDTYLGLVAASSVIRPGVAKSGMMREFILRYRFPERRKEAHPVLADIMPETYGVMVYQEDVIKVAHYFGGLTLEESDMLRRGMSGKFRSREEFMKVKNKFFENCSEKGHSQALSLEIWRQIESFAGYAFAKGHSASYAVESYQSLFLKAYYPLEYMVATINNFGGFYRTELYVHEARLHGAIIEAPCVNNGKYLTALQGKKIFLGFILLKSLEQKTGEKIELERNRNGVFIDLDDFIDRVAITLDQISILIKTNALRFCGKTKKSLLWEAHMKIKKVNFNEHEIDLFKREKIEYTLPPLNSSVLEDAFDELEFIGFPLRSPFALLKQKLSTTILKANELSNYINKEVLIFGYLVTTKTTRTSNQKNMYFGTFLDLNGDFIDTVHFPPVASQYPFIGKGVYSILGKVIEEFDCINIEVKKMEIQSIVEDPRYADIPKKVG